MFKFNFDVEDDDKEKVEREKETELSEELEKLTTTDLGIECKTHSLETLILSLPSSIAYSLIKLSPELTLPRRDIFDVRLQLISQEKEPEGRELGYVDHPSDLLPGVYEGGLKTWECSVDLAVYLHGLLSKSQLPFTGVLELGAGSALPSLTLFKHILSLPPSKDLAVTFHLQDFNALVLELVTLPNLILVWYMSPAGASFRAGDPQEQGREDEQADELELELSPSLVAAFSKSLRTYNITLRFTSGPWSSFQSPAQPTTREKYDLILTSETIYHTPSLPSLISVLREGNGKVLVAAKTLYFGVGGSVDAFRKMVEDGKGKGGGKVQTVWSNEAGVGRVILDVHW